MRWMQGCLAVGVLSLVPFWLVRDDVTAVGVWSLVLALAAAGAILFGVSRNRPPERLPWQLVGCSALAVAAAALASIATENLKANPGFPSPAQVLTLVGAACSIAALALFVRYCTPARDWAAIADAGVVALGVGSVTWIGLVQPALQDEALELTTKVGVVSSAFLSTVLATMATRILLAGTVEITERWLVGAAALTQAAACCLVPVALVHGWAMPETLAPAVVVAAQVIWAAAALHTGMVSLALPGNAEEPWPTRRRLVLLAPAVVAVLSLVAYETLIAGEPVRGVPLAACILLAGLLAARLVGLVSGYERVAEREAALSAGSAALALAKTREEISAAAAETALELAGGLREAYVDVDLSPRPTLEVQDAAVVGTGEIASMLRGQIRHRGSLARVGSARTIVAPIILGNRLQGVVRVTGTRPLAWHLERSLDILASKVALALEGLEITHDLAERKSEARFRSLVQNSHDLIVVLEPDLTVRYVTPSVATLLGREPELLVGTRLDQWLHPDEREHTAARFKEELVTERSVTLEFRLPRADATWRTFEATMSDLLDDPAVSGLVLTARDVSERRALEDELTTQAFHDSLTGLANRALLADRVRHALERSVRTHAHVAVLFLDVDDFKTVNDSLGHEAGDEMLVEIGNRLRTCMRGSDTAARLGGDEFAIVLEETNGVEGAARAAERVLEAVSAPLTLAGAQILPRASIGITFGTAGQTSGELLRNADVAMYQAKRAGGGCYELFDNHMHESALARLQLKVDLERAFRADELDLVYQPIVDLESGMTKSLEVLLRWTHPERGPISPAEFVPLAEETGLIGEIGHWVLDRAARQVRAWQLSIPGRERLCVNVNLSARQILEPDLGDRIAAILSQTGLAPGSLTLEITESAVMEDPSGVAMRLGELRALGIGIAIDDFGTGFSSLGYLRRFPVDELKIAKEFVDDLVDDARAARLVEGIVSLGAALDLRTLAEGIETVEQRQRLLATGCVFGQGYLFARPTRADEVPALLRGDIVAAA